MFQLPLLCNTPRLRRISIGESSRREEGGEGRGVLGIEIDFLGKNIEPSFTNSTQKLYLRVTVCL